MIAFAGSVAMLPIALAMGVRSWVELAILATAIALAGLMAIRGARQAHEKDLPFFVPVFGLVVLVAASTIGGSLLIVPSIAAAFTTPWVMLSSRPRRIYAIGICCLGVLLPVGLGALGVVPFPYTAQGELFCVAPQMLHLPVAMTTVLLTATAVAMILVNGALASGLRDEVSHAEAQTQVLAWQLRQLVPST